MQRLHPEERRRKSPLDQGRGGLIFSAKQVKTVTVAFLGKEPAGSQKGRSPNK